MPYQHPCDDCLPVLSNRKKIFAVLQLDGAQSNTNIFLFFRLEYTRQFITEKLSQTSTVNFSVTCFFSFLASLNHVNRLWVFDKQRAATHVFCVQGIVIVHSLSEYVIFNYLLWNRLSQQAQLFWLISIYIKSTKNEKFSFTLIIYRPKRQKSQQTNSRNQFLLAVDEFIYIFSSTHSICIRMTFISCVSFSYPPIRILNNTNRYARFFATKIWTQFAWNAKKRKNMSNCQLSQKANILNRHVIW